MVDISPGWSEAQPWVLNVNATRSERASEGSERVSSNVGIGPGARSVTLLLNLEPLQGDSLLWNALPGVKTPGLRPLAPSGRRALNTHAAGSGFNREPRKHSGFAPASYFPKQLATGDLLTHRNICEKVRLKSKKTRRLIGRSSMRLTLKNASA